jgi:predicted NBD/HSP70 family sugar kinase
VRLGLPDVASLELWDAPVDGHPLQHWRHHPTFARRLARAVTEVVVAEDMTAAAARIRRVHLLGGGATAAIADALAHAGLQVSLDPDPTFAAVRAGPRAVGRPTDLCADVGQTSIKLWDGHDAWRVERPRELPVRAPDSGPASPAQRSATLDFIADALGARPDAGTLLLALPCALADNGAPTRCSYAWGDPDPTWLDELRTRLGLAADAILVVNDARLAAVAASRDPRLDPTAPTLVLTIGFGVGAAILGAKP